jgi:glycosyltransferase involved in cell wall biosynthesis
MSKQYPRESKFIYVLLYLTRSLVRNIYILLIRHSIIEFFWGSVLISINDDNLGILSVSPRNPWARARKALALADNARPYEAFRTLEHIRYHPDISGEIFDIFVRHIDQRAALGPASGVPLINTPEDYLRNTDLGLRAPFRQLRANAKAPSPFPPSMAMPPLVGVQNDYSFLSDAATVLGPSMQDRLQTTHVIFSSSGAEDLGLLLADISAQTYTGRIKVTVFGDVDAGFAPRSDDRISVEVVVAPLLSVQANLRLREIVDQDEDVLFAFLSGHIRLDPAALDRAAHNARVTDALVQPLITFSPKAALQTPFSTSFRPKAFSGRYPFRDMQGMNFVAPSGLLRRVGLPDDRFGSTYFAARELAFRMFVRGAYFAPLQVSDVKPLRDETLAQNQADAALYISLCPNHWDRKAAGTFERPLVSVYIPAYNASRYIQHAVDSVLEQDFDDLEVCICNDGSRDNTADILQRLYGANPKVHWENRRNGGIGTGSNSAIHMSQGPYIGQLDSDDTLKPGAVRRMAEYLDEHPKTACVYGSCERIDADGNYVKNEYSWPQFSREKMMVTSVAHHFRMFRRANWERTSKFREDIVNGIDYDIFLKLSETGPLHHIDEILYQRRWHGENTSVVNEHHQTANTHRVQTETLKRLGLNRFWEVHIPDPKEPRRVTYRRKPDTRTVLFWPDYSRSNPYQQMLYGEARKTTEICAGNIDAALNIIDEFDDPANLTFHLHWLNFLFADLTDAGEAKSRADDFLAQLQKFVWKGGRVVWTIHNHVSHDTPFRDLEIWLSGEIAKTAHALHFHAAGSVDEVAGVFDIPREKVMIVPHGHYIGAYPDFVSRETAREALGIETDDEVILFTGQVRPYKGVEQLISAFRTLLEDRPKLRLLIVGEMKHDLFANVTPELTEFEAARITATERFVCDMELQLFLRAADLAVYPYEKILTSGSLLLALSFGLPVVIPDVAMTREVIQKMNSGAIYDEEVFELSTVIPEVLNRNSNPNRDGIQFLCGKWFSWKNVLHSKKSATRKESE